MLNIKIIATGDFKENYLREACAEYKKRLGAWCKLEEIILKEEKLPDNPTKSQIDKALELEEKRIFEKREKDPAACISAAGFCAGCLFPYAFWQLEGVAVRKK